MRRLIIPLIAILCLAACSPAEIAAFTAATPEQQATVIAELQRQQASRPKDCYSAMEMVFPPNAHPWARRIIHRESRNNPSAANPRSSARGCWQLLSNLHANRYTAAGCRVSQWADPLCNTRAAYELYKAAGTSPWNV